MIEESEVERALTWLVEHADRAASARSVRVGLEAYGRIVLADEMKASGEQSVAAQEREAYASEAYRNHVIALQEAVKQDERYRWLQRAAESRVECWRTMCSNARVQAKVTE